MVQIHSPQPILIKHSPIPLRKRISNEENDFHLRHQLKKKPNHRFHHHQTKQKASKSKKNDKIFKKMTKKKNALCYNTPMSKY
ncbi:hypothetical protein C2R48_02400 [Helicobacter pylori]|nr:hypothetical protein C2R48_02400 [Helicobacter pylori]